MSTILISEASTGVGAGLAIGLARYGHQVIAASATGEFPDEAPAGLGIVPIEMDITNPASVRGAVAETTELFPELDTLIANGMTGRFGPLELLTDEQVTAMIGVNVTGQLLLLQAVVPHLRTSNRGRIIGISSTVGMLGLPGGVAPCAARAGFEVALDALRHELRPFGVQVSVVQAAPAQAADYGLPLAATKESAVAAAYQPLIDSVNNFGCQTAEPQEVTDLVQKVLDQEQPPFRTTIGDYADVIAQLRLADDDRSAAVIRELFDIA